MFSGLFTTFNTFSMEGAKSVVVGLFVLFITAGFCVAAIGDLYLLTKVIEQEGKKVSPRNYCIAFVMLVWT